MIVYKISLIYFKSQQFKSIVKYYIKVLVLLNQHWNFGEDIRKVWGVGLLIRCKTRCLFCYFFPIFCLMFLINAIKPKVEKK